MKKLIRFQKTVLVLAGLIVCSSLHVSAASAQDPPPSQVTFQFSGVLPSNSAGISGLIDGATTGNTVTENATRSGAFQAGYSYRFTSWIGVDAAIGSARYTENYLGDFGATSVQSDLREYTADFLLLIPVHIARIRPYAVAGVGAMHFSPTDNVNNSAGTVDQTRSAFIYGAGADFDVSKRIGVRAEYRGAKFKVPDYRLPELTTNAETHIGQPSIGIYFRFSGFGRSRKTQQGG